MSDYRRALTVKLRSKKPMEDYPCGSPEMAQMEVQGFLEENGFVSDRDWGYISKNPMSDEQIQTLVKRLAEELDWIDDVIDKLLVTNLGERQSILGKIKRAAAGKRYEVYLFDLDGTLTDSKQGIIKGVIYALEKLGELVPDMKTMMKFIGPPLNESFEVLCGLSQERAAEAVNLHRAYYRAGGMFENAVYEGVRPTLAALKQSGKRLAVATSKPEEFAKKILEHFQLEEFFETIAGAGLDEKKSSKSKVIADALCRMSIDEDKREHTVMVGDRKHDIVGARDNAIDCIAVCYGYGSRQELEEYAADYIVTTPEEILNI